MLEVKNLTKIYKTKGGAEVRALDGVSLQFPEKGMVFLLGKSGSGKSTLLNVAGGLDAPTDGEIIVKGRSSKDFSQTDFDSYRNTFVGFIFQEYNILQEFTVEDNIALALELQGKCKDKAAIEEILAQVDLVGYAKRKPNTLSGGQKQRIAIARALIKSPEIIMADEPTGALDSNTGKQVFETLKKLSKEKLVVVVSHDREFAEWYGDRIIELKDGKIISDVSKVNETQEAFSENVSVVGENTVCVKNGAALSERDFTYIREFLSKTSGTAIIASGNKEISDFKKVSRITDDGKKETFKSTDHGRVEQRSYTPEDGKFIRSKLPARHAFKIGASGLKSKPVRLFFTVLLCSVAFVMFGFLSTLSFYNPTAAFKESMKNSSYTSVRLEKVYRSTETQYQNGALLYSSVRTDSTRFSPEELEEYRQTFGKETFGAIDCSHAEIELQNQNVNYWTGSVEYLALLSEDNPLRANIQGAYPENANEIAITSYTADAIVQGKTVDENKQVIEVKTANELIGKQISFGEKFYKITGIYNCGPLSKEFDSLKENSGYDRALSQKFNNYLQDGLFLTVFLSEERFDDLADSSQYRRHLFNNAQQIALYDENQEIDNERFIHSYYETYTNTFHKPGIVYFEDGKTAPADGEAVINRPLFQDLIEEKIADYLNESINAYGNLVYSDKYKNVPWVDWTNALESGNTDSLPTESDPLYDTYLEWSKFYTAQRYAWELSTINEQYQRGYKSVEDESGNWDVYYFTGEEIKAFAEEILAWIKNNNVTFTIYGTPLNAKNNPISSEVVSYKVVGVQEFYAEREDLAQSPWIYFAQKTVDAIWDIQKTGINWYSTFQTKYQEDVNVKYHTIFLPFNSSSGESLNKITNIYADKSFAEDDSRAYLSGTLIDSLERATDLVEQLSKVFLWIGIIVAIFAALLLSNFISVSISYKKKEIGILRAVGARSLDVFKIFFSESFVITVICIVLSIIGSIVACTLTNAELSAGLGGVTLIVFGPLSIIILVGIALLTAVIATFLPVYLAAKKKPVESIRAL